MKVYYIFIVFILLIVSGKVLSKDVEKKCKEVSDLNVNFQNMWVYRTKFYQSIFISCVEDSWEYQDTEAKNKNVEYSYFASAYLLSALQFNLDNLIFELDRRPNLLERWLKNIEDDIYVWRDDPPCGFDAQKNIIKSLLEEKKSVYVSSRSFNMIKEKFDGLQCRIID